MADNRVINIDYTTIDFDAVRAELIQYLRETGTYKDVDFAASNINTLVGLYAYMGSLFGYYINSIANEPFLPSAKRYKNLNRIARLLNYDPRGYNSAGIDVIGAIDAEYCFGKEDEFFEIPAYSLFPSNIPTPGGDQFTFTNPNNIVYMVKGFGTRPVEQNDFSYSGFSLPYTAAVDFWDTEGTTGTPSFNPSNITLDLSDNMPLTVLDRLSRNQFRGYDVDNVPLFNPSDSDSVGQPFTRSLTMKETTLRIQPNITYYILFTYDSEQSRPFLEILDDSEILTERRDDIISAVRLVPDNVDGTFWTLKEVSNNAKGKFYLGVLGMNNLSSVEFAYDRLESTEAGVKQIHIDINKTGNEPPWQVLVNGTVYTFNSGRISSQIFDINSWDTNVTEYNVNLSIVTPDAPDFNYDAKLNVTSKSPTVNEVTIAKIYPGYTDPESGTPTILRDTGQRFGNFQLVPEVNVETTEQKTGFVSFSEGVTNTFVAFDNPFTPPASGNVEYAISLTPSENVQVWFTEKSEDGFTINVEPNSAFEGDVNWVATKIDPSDSREIDVVFSEPIPQIDGQDAPYTVFLTPNENVRVWYEDQTPEGFKVKVEKSYTGDISYSTFVFSNNQSVLEEANSSTQRKGTVTLSGDQTTRDIVFDGEFDNTDYGLHMVANKNVNVWYTNKTTTGFTINVESTDGNVIIDWYADSSPLYRFQKHGTINFAGQITSAGTLPGLRYTNIDETFMINDLKQGEVRFSFINKNGTINSANNQLGIQFSADRKSEKEIKFQVGAQNISYNDLRVFIKNEAGDWEEWENASALTASSDISPGEKVFFARVEDTKRIEISFGNGVDFGKDPYGNEMYIFGLRTVGSDGNIPPNSLADSVVLSKEILGDDNITLQFEQQFIQLIGLKSETFFASDERTSSTVIYDSQGTRVDSDILTIRQNTPAFGGADPENTEELRFNASSANLRQDRIVSLDDYATFTKSAFNDIILKAQALSYREALEAGFVESDDPKFFFNYIFLVVLPKVGNEITKKQRDYIVNTLDERFKSMTTVEHEVFSAINVPVDVRVRFKPTRLGNVTSVQTNIQRVVRDFFEKNKRNLGETLHHSDLVTDITNNVSNVDYVEIAWHKDVDDKLTPSDYDIDAVTDVNETVAEVKRRKILELLAKDESLLTIVEPLLDVTDSTTGEREWVFTFNLKLERFEFPVLGDIIIEVDSGANS
jgi:hypothetical protein